VRSRFFDSICIGMEGFCYQSMFEKKRGGDCRPVIVYAEA
jgi:hypothetical protein